MPTSQDLVPNNQPYGARQQNVAAMQQAGLPLASTPSSPPQLVNGGGGGPVASPPTAGGFSPLSLLQNQSPSDFPFTSAVTQPPAGAQPDTFAALQASAQSSFAVAVMQRLQESRRA